MSLLMYTLHNLSNKLINMQNLWIFPVLFIILYLRNKNYEMFQKSFLGIAINSPLEQTISQIVLGLLAGIIGSIIIVYLGAAFRTDSLDMSLAELIFFMTVIRIIFPSRKVTLPIIGIVAVIFNSLYLIINSIGKNIRISFENIELDTSSIFILIGVLGIMEGILILVDGENGALAHMEVRAKKMVGFFTYSRIWPTPLITIYLLSKSVDTNGNEVNILSNSNHFLNTALNNQSILIFVTALVCGFAFLNYSDVTHSESKKGRIIYSGTIEILFSIVILICAWISSLDFIFDILSIMIILIIQIVLIQIDKKRRNNGEFLYISGNSGIRILDVEKYSIAYDMKITSGDMIMKINGLDVTQNDNMETSVKKLGNEFTIQIKKINGEIVNKVYKNKKCNQRIGFVYIPKKTIELDDLLNSDADGKLNEVIERMKKDIMIDKNEEDKNEEDKN